MKLSERVLLSTSLLKESVDIFGEDLRKENMDGSLLILGYHQILNLVCLMKRE